MKALRLRSIRPHRNHAGSCVLKKEKNRYGSFDTENSGLFPAADVEIVIIIRVSEKESESYNIS